MNSDLELAQVLREPWWVLPAEVLHGLTFAAMWAATTDYAHGIAPGTFLCCCRCQRHRSCCWCFFCFSTLPFWPCTLLYFVNRYNVPRWLLHCEFCHGVVALASRRRSTQEATNETQPMFFSDSPRTEGAPSRHRSHTPLGNSPPSRRRALRDHAQKHPRARTRANPRPPCTRPAMRGPRPEDCLLSNCPSLLPTHLTKTKPNHSSLANDDSRSRLRDPLGSRLRARGDAGRAPVRRPRRFQVFRRQCRSALAIPPPTCPAHGETVGQRHRRAQRAAGGKRHAAS